MNAITLDDTNLRIQYLLITKLCLRKRLLAGVSASVGGNCSVRRDWIFTYIDMTQNGLPVSLQYLIQHTQK